MVLLRSGGLPVLSTDEGIETTRQRQLSVCEEVNRTDVVSNACSYVVVGGASFICFRGVKRRETKIRNSIVVLRRSSSKSSETYKLY